MKTTQRLAALAVIVAGVCFGIDLLRTGQTPASYAGAVIEFLTAGIGLFMFRWACRAQ